MASPRYRRPPKSGRARAFPLLPLLLLHAAPAIGELPEGIEKRMYESRRVSGKAPVVDGRLDEEVWDTVEWTGDFVQREPAEGEAPSQRTRFKVVYDDLVIRWEYRPGSAIFLVWSQVRDEGTLVRGGGRGFGDELDQLFAALAEDVILLKVSRWFSP